MNKHYTNEFRENADERIKDLQEIGITAFVGDPGPSEKKTAQEISASGMGIVGIWFKSDDPRPGHEIVNEAWSIYFQNNH